MCESRLLIGITRLPTVIVGTVVAVLFSVATGCGTEVRTAEVTDKMNFLLIAIDDLNDWTTFVGGCPGKVEPRNLVRVGQRGVFFRLAHYSAPACNPSRASLLCGVRPSTSGVYSNSNPWHVQMPAVVTLAQHFVAHGYKVWGGGKVFHRTFEDPESWEVYFQRPVDRSQQRDFVEPLVGTRRILDQTSET